jgi:ketosteroid isomerase-like protein
VEAAVSNSEGVALVRQAFDWLQHGATDSFLSALHPDIEARPSIGDGRCLHGRAEVAAWLHELTEAKSDLELRPLEFEPVRDCVVVRGYLRHRAGRTLAESQVFWVCEVKDGQVVRIESHASRSSAIAAC